MKRRLTQLLACLLLIAAVYSFVPFDVQSADAEKPHWLGPAAIVASPQGDRLFVALADARQVAAVDASTGRIVAQVDVPGEPTALCLDAPKGRLYVACAAPKSTVCVLDSQTLKTVQSIAAGHTASGLALTPDGAKLFVCNRFNNDVSVYSLPEGRQLARVKVSHEPVDATITPDGKTVFVINLLPNERSDREAPAVVVTAIDAASLATSEVRLPDGSSSVRGICASPDGRHVFVTHSLSRSSLPTTQVERGWMNTSAVSIIDAREKTLLGTVLLDDVDRGAANPCGVACTPNGATLCVAHSGTHEMSVIDLRGILDKLAARTAALRTPTAPRTPAPPAPTYNSAPSWDNSVVSTPLEPVNDLSFLTGLRRRVPLSGNGPRGVTVANGKAYAAMYFSDTLAAVNLNGSAAANPPAIPLGPPPKSTAARRGEMIFHDATLCFQHWQSCASCHPDARSDALNWDLLNDGYGNPKNAKSMLLVHRTPPAMSQGVRESAEAAVRSGFRAVLFAQVPEEDAQAVDTYLRALRPVPSPYLVDGRLSPAAVRGKKLFNSVRVGCAECHPAPLFTDLRHHDVGTRGPSDNIDEFDTPTLVECWRTAPYLHDGRCKTMAELIGKQKHGTTVGDVEGLSPQEIADLIEYVLSL
jgi:DNA-binding beta-propeller fold protein YncE/mono/diheme cytochrome c family protein